MIASYIPCNRTDVNDVGTIWVSNTATACDVFDNTLVWLVVADTGQHPIREPVARPRATTVPELQPRRRFPIPTDQRARSQIREPTAPCIH
jgi:hypothetical protein